MTTYLLAVAITLSNLGAEPATQRSVESNFRIGPDQFLLNDKPFVIRSGEMHAARIPAAYWRHRLAMVRAMGCNTVCAYLFWNQHEPLRGKFDFSAQADVREYCRIAHELGLKVILRPGPYSCAEWDFGGLPWWLLKTPDIRLRTRDPQYLDAARRYLLRVGQELAPMQITHGGPIIMVQVENEYGSFGDDKEYIGKLRDILRDAGFDVPMFTCDGPSLLKNDTRDDIFCVVNFGSDPASAFKALREIRPSGPLMCGEYYPGWFDSWGKPHHRGSTKHVLDDLEYMLTRGQSFSIYMVHGGTSFGFWSGANAPPFRPQSTSYDYDAPIDEAGRATSKFNAIRELFSRHLNPGESIPPPPDPMPIQALPEIVFHEAAAIFSNLGPARHDEQPRSMEMYDQGYGYILYRTTLPAGGAAELVINEPHDFAQVYLDGRNIATLDRRYSQDRLPLFPRASEMRLDILVEAMGRVNYGPQLCDRKGITDSVTINSNGKSSPLSSWDVFNFPLDEAQLRSLKFKAGISEPLKEPALYRAAFSVEKPADTYLDMRGWSKGLVWVNGHNLGRYWNIGPQQTLYLPGCWLKNGENEIIVLDITGEAKRLTTRGLAQPILDEVGIDLAAPQLHRKPGESVTVSNPDFEGVGRFDSGKSAKTIDFDNIPARFLVFEALNSQNGDPFTTCAEINVRHQTGHDLPKSAMKVLFADSEELDGDDGNAANVLDGRADTFWHTEWSKDKPGHPHRIVIDLGSAQHVASMTYLPRQDSPNGRIRDYRVILLSNNPLNQAEPLERKSEPPGLPKAHVEGPVLRLDNNCLSVAWKTDSGLTIDRIIDKSNNDSFTPSAPALSIRLQDGKKLDSSDMKIVTPPHTEELKASNTGPLAGQKSGVAIVVTLREPNSGLEVGWRGILRDGAHYLRQEITLKATKNEISIDQVILLELNLGGASVIGTCQGSPITAGNVFVAAEHPMSESSVVSDVSICKIKRVVPLRPGRPATYSSVIGTAAPGQMRRSFLAYLERERAHPYRPFLHYNSWYDIGFFTPFNETDGLRVIADYTRELVQKRGVKIDSFLFDDGWDNYESLWEFHKGFPNGFVPLKNATAKIGAAPGVWLSPWGGYGKPRERRLAFGKSKGMEINAQGYTLSGPKYYARFREVVRDFVTRQGINHFKFDGTGSPDKTCPGSEFDSDFDAAIKLISELRGLRPDLFINLTTGTWPSPFWLRYADTIWRGGEDHSFAGVGSDRQRWITYRDADTYRGVVLRGPLFPLNSLMLHGIICASNAHQLNKCDDRDFRDEVRSYFASGTCLQEMYVSPSLLKTQNWDDLAEAAKWARANADVLVDTHWVGGDPGRLEVYGWASWSPRKGVLALRNPSDQPQDFSVDVAAVFELPQDAGKTYLARSPYASESNQKPIQLDAGAAHQFRLEPFEVLVLETAANQPP